MKPLVYSALALLLPVAAAQAAGLGSYPADETCAAERNAAREEGYAAGDANGYSRGYPIGYGDGTAAGIAQCVADPQSCAITLASCIPDATYGETEPNDNAIAADPLTLGISFWGQNYSGVDQDWYYTESTAANQNLIVNFSVPDWIAGANLAGGVPAIWNISVRDAAGNIFGDFNTNIVGAVQATANAVTYNVTLGLVGTYYVVVQPSDKTQSNAYSYSVSAFLQDSGLSSSQPIVGFSDTEIEPNDVPSRSNPLATGVAMYGLTNLSFSTPLPSSDDDGSFVWGQGENDWYVYYTKGNELATLTFCAREACGPGNWFIEIYDQASATALESGTPSTSLTPLLSVNTDTTNDPTATFRIGLKDPGYYFMRVNHKRLFTAPCLAHQFVSSATEGGFGDACECESGDTCYIPNSDCSDATKGLVCKSEVVGCTVGIEAGCLSIPNDPPGCGVPDVNGTTVACNTYQTQARCACSQYGGVVEVPENEYTSPYNFTWHGTQLPTNTIDTDAYEDYLNRSNPYQ